ncbi:PAAR domain-containing protein [Stutzerimonas stutzeri]|uniref:Type IV secretion protein Rhs n=1 Tax=Stutzerimonas stutzeri TaxID=316 RepID=A0A6I6LKM9_STUST|nr:PAAR domain-containing protein [Stutzerimonas stutzeri]QGZ30998.1 type IV secretion protein Rhs [Stutzerimonas stutzeri]
MRRYHITVGSPTTAGGSVVTGWERSTLNGKHLAREGDTVACPACGATGTIACTGPRLQETFEGRLAALEGDLCLCKCSPPPRLVANQTLRYQTLGDSPASRAGAPFASPQAAPVGSQQAAPQTESHGLQEEEEEEEELTGITLRLGLFFDGTGNNQSNSEAAAGCRARDVGLTEEEAKDIRQRCDEYGFDAEGNVPDNSYGNHVTNIARLHGLYPDDSIVTLPKDADKAHIKVYLEGIGTLSGSSDSLYGKATGRGATGVVARVEQAPGLVMRALRLLQENNPDVQIRRIEIDLFGFSRGAAAARHCANDLLKGADSLLAKVLPAGSPLLNAGFAWRHKRDFELNFIGLFDTVAAIFDPWSGDLSPANAANPGLELRLAPGCARKVVHLVANTEWRHNFPLVKTDNDIQAPGAHSDLGGGYPPVVRETILLDKPLSNLVSRNTAEEDTAVYQRIRQLLEQDMPLLQDYVQRMEVYTWSVDQPYDRRDHLPPQKRVYAAARSIREVRGELSLVYLRVMRDLAVRAGVAFEPILDTPDFALPEELQPISEKLRAQALGDSTVDLTAEEAALLRRRYIHLSANWNASNNPERDILFINRPAKNALRKVYPNA